MKRYDSYKDSGVEWIREIPSHWDLERYKHLGDSSSTNISVNEFQNEEVIHYSIPNVQKKGTGVLEIGEDIDSSKLLLSGGELMISKLNPRKNCVCIVSQNHNYKILGSGEFVLLKPNGTNTKFLFYYVNNPSYTEYLDSSVESVTRSHQRVNPSIIYNSKVSLPPLSEQQQIVSFLDTKTSLIDSLIEKTQRKIELLKEKRTSLINEVVTKGLNPNVEMKDSGVEWIGEIPSHWEESQFKFYIKLRHGHQFRDGDFTDEGIKIVKITQLDKGGFLNLSKCSKIDKERLNDFEDILIYENDILMCLTGGTIGKIIKVGKVDEPLLQNYRVGHFSPIDKKSMGNNYMFYLTSSEVIVGQIFYDVRETGQPNIGMEDMNRMRICVPPISEQQQIVEYLDEQTGLIDNTISIEEKRIELLKEYRQSLISEV